MAAETGSIVDEDDFPVAEIRLPPYPGEILREESLVLLDMNVDKLSKACQIDALQLADITAGKQIIGDDMAVKLDRIFGTNRNTGTICRRAT